MAITHYSPVSSSAEFMAVWRVLQVCPSCCRAARPIEVYRVRGANSLAACRHVLAVVVPPGGRTPVKRTPVVGLLSVGSLPRGPLSPSRGRSQEKQSVLLRSTPRLSPKSPKSPASPRSLPIPAISAALWRSRPVAARSRIKIPDTHPLMFQFWAVDHIITG